MFPTIAGVTGANMDDDTPIDGANILPILRDEKFSRAQPLFWLFYKSVPMCVLRDGKFLLAANPAKGQRQPRLDLSMHDACT